MDVECIKLCNALNKLPGIETFESCSGHSVNPFFVAFKCSSFESLAKIAEGADGTDWTIQAVWASGGGKMYFTLAGPEDGADYFAEWISA
jgi:hypothetical protein